MRAHVLVAVLLAALGARADAPAPRPRPQVTMGIPSRLLKLGAAAAESRFDVRFDFAS